ncbi:MAG: DUF1559 domain-containing protein, partial [Phycisphaerales bacterium]|nr:DUF1559 domain-containing protein [Phycisphaerales bacterium]
VVISIILVLVTILVPIIGTAQRRARQMQCATNLRGIGSALGVYTTSGGNQGYPFIQNKKDMVPTAEMQDLMGETEFKQLLKKEDEKNVHIIDNLLLLVQREYLDNWSIFRCPSTSGNVLDRDDDETYGFYDKANDEYYIDYAMHNGYKYGGDGKYNTASFGVGMKVMPILADQPGESLKEFVRHSDVAEAEVDDGNEGAGYNHGQDIVNCLYPGATVKAQSKVYCGLKDNNIYARDIDSSGKVEVPVESRTTTEVSFPTGNEKILKKSDSVLIPANINDR